MVGATGARPSFHTGCVPLERLLSAETFQVSKKKWKGFRSEPLGVSLAQSPAAQFHGETLGVSE